MIGSITAAQREELEREIAGLKAKAERVAEEAAGIDDAWTVEIRERIRKFNAGETKGDSAS